METKEKRQETEQTPQKKERLVRWRSNPIWILLVFVALYIFVSVFVWYPGLYLLYMYQDQIPDSVYFIVENYVWTISSILVLFLLCWLIRPNRYIWKSFLLPGKHTASIPNDSDVLAEFYGRSRNGFKMLVWGLLLGFLTNFFGIACALIHGDIKLYFDSDFRQIPLFLFALFAVWLQSSSEELWCRGFLYERFHERYPLWVSVAVNGILFGALHCFNDGASVLSILEIMICGISYSLLRWYTGNIWIVMGVHTGWNFTQAFLFGLPNSGLVSAVSLFHLDASTGVSNLIYDFDFGVEGGLPGLLADLLLGVVVLVLAARSGRLKELKMNRARTMEAANGNDVEESST